MQKYKCYEMLMAAVSAVASRAPLTAFCGGLCKTFFSFTLREQHKLAELVSL